MTIVLYNRRFVPSDSDMGNWAHIEALFDQLEAMSVDTVEGLEQWLSNYSDFVSCLSEEGDKRYVTMTCNTDDEEAEKSYLSFMEDIDQRCKPRINKLVKKYLASKARSHLSDFYKVYDQSTQVYDQLYREENIALDLQDDTLSQQYQKLCGAMSVTFRGKEHTLQQMSKYAYDTDRDTRKEAWNTVSRCWLGYSTDFDNIYDQMIKLRSQIAANAGFNNYRDYMFTAYERFDYTPKDCFDYHNAIAKYVVPIKHALQEKREKDLGVSSLRPWDLAVDVKGRDPLKPFETVAELCEKCSTIFHHIDPELGDQFADIVSANWMDLESRKGKAPGGYQTSFEEQRHPFIFMNSVGLHSDVETLLREGGHAFHYLACRHNHLRAYRHCGMEMAEVASMSMELLGIDHLDIFYSNEEDLLRAKYGQLTSIIDTLCWVAAVDAFQHWIYLNPNHTRAGRSACWISLMERFGGIECWRGYFNVRSHSWHRQLHIFEVPFYYIEYGIAQIGALQLWRNAKLDRKQALGQYKAALALGGSKSLPELWEAAGLKFDFTVETIESLVSLVKTELENCI